MTKNTKVLALKYRPQALKDLIGQDVIMETIFNSIKENKIPNAYLFTGIRGTGKTSTARIIAKALNCKNKIDNLCKENLCDHCEAITNSNHIDVLEMDAASKTGVDDVRDLIDFSRYGPTSAKYKIFIIDEVHMLSKQAFNALLKTLEEPPQYENGGGLKFIFATTEIKKIPITVVSRCQRFDLSRVKSNELFKYIKEIKEKENGNVSDDALKLIVKISEGSVRDALSLLDRLLLSTIGDNEINLDMAQKLFGYFDKSQLINLIKLIFEGKQKEVLEIYRSIYDQGIEPRIFINDFLEILYYFKNIEHLKLDGNNFSLNDDDFKIIKEITKNIKSEIIILYWQFTIKTLEELNVVSNQNLSIEMFLIRLIYLKDKANISELIERKKTSPQYDNTVTDEIVLKDTSNNNDIFDLKNKTIGQIKNTIQEKQTEQNPKNNENDIKNNVINNFNDLLIICETKKEVKLKYELEKNVNLVSFENQRIEISFNEDLDKEFIKILSSKLYEWTKIRWIITLSKKKGDISIREKEINKKKNSLVEIKKSEAYKKIIDNLSDAELIDVKIDKE
ncbi:DNA polymerase III subunit gamma/tau [Candidatus Pelagibacter sp.]|nr:DNA polymerase III subunit gamma/tau [Candidatus Pelagibacter sp.]